MFHKLKIIIFVNLVLFSLLSEVNAQGDNDAYNVSVDFCKDTLKMLAQDRDVKKEDHDKIKQACDEIKKSCKILSDPIETIYFVDNPSKEQEYEKCNGLTKQVHDFFMQRVKAHLERSKTS